MSASAYFLLLDHFSLQSSSSSLMATSKRVEWHTDCLERVTDVYDEDTVWRQYNMYHMIMSP